SRGTLRGRRWLAPDHVAQSGNPSGQGVVSQWRTPGTAGLSLTEWSSPAQSAATTLLLARSPPGNARDFHWCPQRVPDRETLDVDSDAVFDLGHAWGRPGYAFG